MNGFPQVRWRNDVPALIDGQRCAPRNLRGARDLGLLGSAVMFGVGVGDLLWTLVRSTASLLPLIVIATLSGVAWHRVSTGAAALQEVPGQLFVLGDAGERGGLAPQAQRGFRAVHAARPVAERVRLAEQVGGEPGDGEPHLGALE